MWASRTESFLVKFYLCLGFLEEYLIVSKIIDPQLIYPSITLWSVLMYSLFQQCIKTYN
jgi:hypothetical protein